MHQPLVARLVWCVPLAALLIVVFLGVLALADRGIDVVVTFDQAAGARFDDTKVIYLGAEAGHVTKIQVNADGRRIDMTLRLDPRAKRALTTTTKFWLVSAKRTLSDISSVKAAVAGMTIGVAPGIGGAPARHSDGLGEPPVVMPGTAGAGYVLHANDLGAARMGSAICFHGQEVGRITATRFVAPAAFDLDIFVFAPYDHLMRPSARFWVASAIQVALIDKGVTANVERLNAVFNASLELELPEAPGSAPARPPGASSRLAMFKTAQPQIGPLLKKLNQAATELTSTVTAARGVMTGEGADGDASFPDAIRPLNEAARSVRSLSDYLGRHPESLIRGRHDATSEAPTQDSR